MTLPDGLTRCACCGGAFVREPGAMHFCSPDCRLTGEDLMPEDIERRLAEAAWARAQRRLTDEECHARTGPALGALAVRLLDAAKGAVLGCVIALDRVMPFTVVWEG